MNLYPLVINYARDLLLLRYIVVADDSVRDLRNVAMLALQYDTMTRRSELVAIALEDIARQEDGSGTVIIRRSKTDQAGEGAAVQRQEKSTP